MGSHAKLSDVIPRGCGFDLRSKPRASKMVQLLKTFTDLIPRTWWKKEFPQMSVFYTYDVICSKTHTKINK